VATARRPVCGPNYQDTLKKSETRAAIGSALRHAACGYEIADGATVPFRHKENPVSKSLITLALAGAAASTRQAHGQRADFIAHLIAVRLQAPQTRARRRAEPEDATAAYGALGQWPTPAGRVFSRAL
jgi:hypothetical protein